MSSEWQLEATTRNSRALRTFAPSPTSRFSPAFHPRHSLGVCSRAPHSTHGLHVSSVAPADDIFIEVGPGQSQTYTYSIPTNHMGGTFWYHAHHHGSTNMHAGGGALGAIIVEDPSGSIPAEVAALEEMLLLLHHFNMPELTAVAQEYETNCQNAGGSAADCAETVFAPGASSGTQSNSVLPAATPPCHAIRDVHHLHACATDAAHHPNNDQQTTKRRPHAFLRLFHVRRCSSTG